jgi:hypothetical protein
MNPCHDGSFLHTWLSAAVRYTVCQALAASAHVAFRMNFNYVLQYFGEGFDALLGSSRMVCLLLPEVAGVVARLPQTCLKYVKHLFCISDAPARRMLTASANQARIRKPSSIPLPSSRAGERDTARAQSQ